MTALQQSIESGFKDLGQRMDDGFTKLKDKVAALDEGYTDVEERTSLLEEQRGHLNGSSSPTQ